MVRAEVDLEEEKLSPAARKVLAKMREAIQDTELLARIAKLLTWFDNNYGLGGLFDMENLKQLEGIKMKETSFAWISNDAIVAMPFDTKIINEHVLYTIDLSYVKPLHKHLDKLMLSVIFPAKAIEEELKKQGFKQNEISKIIKIIKEKMAYPVYAVDEDGNIALIIAPRVEV